MSRVDVVIIGAGHNSLVTAAGLARAGRSVVVLEQHESTGGALATEEFAPGFRGPLAFPSVEMLHPQISRELDLTSHGFEQVARRGGTFVPTPEGAALYLKSIGGRVEHAGALNQADAAAIDAFESFLGRIGVAFAPVLTRPLAALAPQGVGELLDLIKMGWKLARLGPSEIPEVLRYLPMSMRDVVDERFGHPVLKAAVAAPGLTGSWFGPRSPGSAYTLVHHRSAWVGGLFSPPAFAKGGPGALAGALTAAARAAGATIRTEARVERIRIDDLAARGVVLEGGEEIEARKIVSGVDPRRTLLELAEPGWLDPDVAHAAAGIRARGTVGIVNLALEALPRFPGAPAGEEHLAGRVLIGSEVDYLERAFDPVKYGQLAERPMLELTFPSLSDPTLAPQGQHVMTAWVQHVPYRDADDGGAAQRDALGDVVLATLEEYAPGLSASVLHRSVRTPFDLEQRLGLSGGCLYHAELALDQMLYMRPLPGWYRHRLPIENLYLCGPGAHPGGGVTGLPGRNATACID